MAHTHPKNTPIVTCFNFLFGVNVLNSYSILPHTEEMESEICTKVIKVDPIVL